MLMNIVHECGHVVEHDMGGAWDLRLKKIAVLEAELCGACRTKG